jgi:glucose-1-phosphate cytidylyltransferase
MKTIILCGGLGTRMKEETEYKPKPMVMIGNKPILWHVMKIYASYGFNEFILALGYKAEYIKDFFLNQKAFTSDFTLKTRNHETKYYLENRSEVEDFTITFVDTGVETLIGERILKCEKYLPKNENHFMVTYGDGVADINIAELVKFHKRQKTIGTITAIHPRSKFGLIKITGNNLIREIEEKPQLADWVNGGFMVFKRDFFRYLRPEEMEHPALNRLAAMDQLSVFRHEGFWYAIDTYREYEELNKLWQQGSPPWKVWP